MYKVEKVDGGIDVLVNSGAPSRKNRSPDNISLEAFTMEGRNYAMILLVKALASFSREALPYLIRSQGSIVNFGSIAGALTTHQTCAYHSGKAAIEQSIRSLASELGGSGVRVNAMCPGIVERAVEPSIKDDPENKEVIKQVIPLQRSASSNDIANVVIFLSSNAGLYITGQSIVADGRLSLGEQFGVAKKIMRSKELKSEDRDSRASHEGDGT
ncbi:SDR family oxidoreductase [Luminiphilus sp.]|nr:SDR family oxidoreductase [Luminiphilus sp.]